MSNSKWVDGLTKEQQRQLSYLSAAGQDAHVSADRLKDQIGWALLAFRKMPREPREWEGQMIWPHGDAPDYAIAITEPVDMVDGVRPTRVRITEVLED